MGIRPRVCPKCGCRRLSKHETMGSQILGLISYTYFVVASLLTVGVYALVGNKPRNIRTIVYKCKNRHCRYEWEADVQ